MEILLSAEAKFPKEAAIPYNLACFYCQFEEIETAKRYLKKAFGIEPPKRIEWGSGKKKQHDRQNAHDGSEREEGREQLDH